MFEGEAVRQVTSKLVSIDQAELPQKPSGKPGFKWRVPNCLKFGAGGQTQRDFV